MEHFSQDSCISASCIQFSSRGALDEVDSACKTECATTAIMMPSCCKRLQANPLIPVGEIPFLVAGTGTTTTQVAGVSLLLPLAKAGQWDVDSRVV